MDLADIRKKAKQERDGSPPAGDSHPPAQSPAPGEKKIPGETPPPATAGEAGEATPPPRNEGPDRETVPAPPVAPQASQAARPENLPQAQPERKREDDPLERLFAFAGDGDFASEDSYLQGLGGQAEMVEEDLCQWLTFSLDSEEYALDIDRINEIIKPREVTEIPRVPDFILGVISLRGIIVPVFDLKRRLRLGSVEVTSASRIVVCQDGERSAGLLVDRINQVVRIPAARVEPPPMVLSGIDRDLVEGVGRHQNTMLIQLHLPGVLNPELV